MPTIAQKHCYEIVEPEITPSDVNNKNRIGNTDTYFNFTRNGKPSHSVKFESKKAITKTDPSSITNSNRNVNKCNKIVNKKIKSSGVNTIISGPLKCHHHCLTSIHRRVNKLDKACTHCIQTVSCGTQFYDNINGILKQGKRSKSSIRGVSIRNNEARSSRSNVTKSHFSSENIKCIEKSYVLQPPCLRYAGGKHWALSNYTTRGPDF